MRLYYLMMILGVIIRYLSFIIHSLPRSACPCSHVPLGNITYQLSLIIHGVWWTNLGALYKGRRRRITIDDRYADGHSLPPSGIDGRTDDECQR